MMGRATLRFQREHQPKRGGHDQRDGQYQNAFLQIAAKGIR